MTPRIPLWIVMGGDGALCKRCGGTERPPLPMSIDAFVKWGDYFGEKHRWCVELPAVTT